MHHIKSNCLSPFFSLLEIFIQKDYFSCFMWVWKESLRLTLIQIGGLYPLRLTRCNNKVLCVYSLSGHNTREQLAIGHVFERLKNCVGVKSEGNKNKAILADFICPMDKIDRDHGKKTQRLNICDSNYVLLKLIVDDVLK